MFGAVRRGCAFNKCADCNTDICKPGRHLTDGAEPPGGCAAAIWLTGCPQSRYHLQIRAAISLVGSSTLLGSDYQSLPPLANRNISSAHRLCFLRMAWMSSICPSTCFVCISTTYRTEVAFSSPSGSVIKVYFSQASGVWCNNCEM